MVFFTTVKTLMKTFLIVPAKLLNQVLAFNVLTSMRTLLIPIRAKVIKDCADKKKGKYAFH